MEVEVMPMVTMSLLVALVVGTFAVVVFFGLTSLVFMGTLHKRLERLMAKIDDLEAAVRKNTDAEDSVLTLLQGIAEQLRDAHASGDPARIDALIKSMDESTSKLAAAVVANTPTDPAPEPQPDPV